METPDFERRKDGREQRSLYLDEWRINVRPQQELSARWTETAAEFGQTFLKTAFLLNGGALIALPPLMQWLGAAQREQVFSISMLFVVGIICATIATASAYFNFTFLSEVANKRADLRSRDVNNFYSAEPKNLSDDPEYQADGEKVETKNRFVLATQITAILFGIGAYILFVVGAADFRNLVKMPTTPAPVVAPE